jgi:hypothetical protein
VALQVDDCPPSDIKQRDTVFFHDSYNLVHAKDSDQGLSVLPRTQIAPRVVTSTFTVPSNAALGVGRFIAFCGRFPADATASGQLTIVR